MGELPICPGFLVPPLPERWGTSRLSPPFRPLRSPPFLRYIKGTAAGKYNIIVEGDNGIVTAMKGKTSAEVRALAERYGWHL